jgi:YbgC/YbaW family acyl-CoA thioester hydrolase
MGQPARTRLTVRFHEADSYGHVNHAHYVHYLEAGRVEALDALGLSLAEMRRQGYLLVAAAIDVRFHAPARPGDVVEVLTQIRELRGARSIWAQEIREASSQRVLVTAEVTGAFMTEGGRPVRIPAAFARTLAALCAGPAGATTPATSPGAPGASAAT